MAYTHVNEYYTGYFAEGSSDYAGQQGPGYTNMSVSPTTNTSKTVNIYFAEPVICTAASGKFYRTNSPSVYQNIDVSYRVLSSQTWTNIRPSEPIDAMVLKCYQFNQWSGGLSGFTWEFASLFTWGEEPDPEPEPEPVDPVDPDPSTLNTGYLPVPRQILLFRRRACFSNTGASVVPATYVISDRVWFSETDIENMINGYYGSSWQGGMQANDAQNFVVTFSRPVKFLGVSGGASYYDLSKSYTIKLYNGTTQVLSRDGNYQGTSWNYSSSPILFDKLTFYSASTGYAMWRTGFYLHIDIDYLT